MPISFNFNDSSLIFIYHMGKVGSNGLRASLEDIGCNYNYAQTLRRERLDQIARLVPATNSETLSFTKHQMEIVNSINNIYNQKFKVITGIREPIGFYISAIFESINTKIGADNFVKYHGEINAKNISKSIISAFELFFSNGANDSLEWITKKENDHINQIYNVRLPWRWLDEEMKHVLDIDAYAAPLSESNDFLITNRIFLYKFENISESMHHELAKFVGSPSFFFTKRNENRKKIFGELYSDLLMSIKIPQFMLDYIYNTRYMQHFYSQNEIDRLYEYWKAD